MYENKYQIEKYLSEMYFICAMYKWNFCIRNILFHCVPLESNSNLRWTWIKFYSSFETKMQYAIIFQDNFTIVHEFLSNLRLNRQHQCVFLIFSAYFRYFVSSHKDGAHSQKAPNSLFSFFFWTSTDCWWLFWIWTVFLIQVFLNTDLVKIIWIWIWIWI